MSPMEALRAASGWLEVLNLPGSAAARKAIAHLTPLILSGDVSPQDLDDLASLIETHGTSLHDPRLPLELQRDQLHEAIRAAFERVEQQRS